MFTAVKSGHGTIMKLVFLLGVLAITRAAKLPTEETIDEDEAASEIEILKTNYEDPIALPSDRSAKQYSTYWTQSPQSYGPTTPSSYAAPVNNYVQKDYVPPQNNYAPPQNNYLSQNDYVPPQNNYVPPKNNYVSPQNNYIPPQNNYVPPQNNYVPPTNNYFPPQKDPYVPPQNNYKPPHNNYVPPQNNYVPPQNNYVPPQNNYIPPQNNYVPPQNNYVPPQNNYVPPQNNYVPPQNQYVPPKPTTEPVPVIKNEQEFGENGSYRYEYQIGDGTHVGEQGYLVNPRTENESLVKKGWYSYVGGDGKTYTVSWWADDSGFHAVGDHLPTPPPVPPAIQAAIEQNAKEEAAKAEAEKNKPQQGYYPPTTQSSYYNPTTQAPYYPPSNPPQNQYYPPQNQYYPQPSYPSYKS